MNNLMKGQDQMNRSDRWLSALSSPPDKVDLHLVEYIYWKESDTML